MRLPSSKKCGKCRGVGEIDCGTPHEVTLSGKPNSMVPCPSCDGSGYTVMTMTLGDLLKLKMKP